MGVTGVTGRRLWRWGCVSAFPCSGCCCGAVFVRFTPCTTQLLQCAARCLLQAARHTMQSFCTCTINCCSFSAQWRGYAVHCVVCSDAALGVIWRTAIGGATQSTVVCCVARCFAAVVAEVRRRGSPRLMHTFPLQHSATLWCSAQRTVQHFWSMLCILQHGVQFFAMLSVFLFSSFCFSSCFCACWPGGLAQRTTVQCGAAQLSTMQCGTAQCSAVQCMCAVQAVVQFGAAHWLSVFFLFVLVFFLFVLVFACHVSFPRLARLLLHSACLVCGRHRVTVGGGGLINQSAHTQ